MAVIKRVKEKIKKLIEKKVKKVKKPTTLSPVKKAAVKKSAVKTEEKPRIIKEPDLHIKKEILGLDEVVVEKSKFSHPQVRKQQKMMPHDLPNAYGKDKIALQIRDPWWLHSYWEVVGSTWNNLKSKLKESFYSAKKVLRVYDVSNIEFNGQNAHKYFDIEVYHEATSWYIDTGNPGKSWCVDLGLKMPNGEFITILRSNVVSTPLDGPSWVTDEEWATPEEIFARLYGMGFGFSGGFGKTSPGGKWQDRFKHAMSSGVLSSPGLTSMGSPVRLPIKAKGRKFWLVVDCELIVYGATEPDAKVSVQGKTIKLRPDGTFTFRYALPDGKQFIPVVAESADEIEIRTITPIVSRETKSSQVVKEVSEA